MSLIPHILHPLIHLLVGFLQDQDFPNLLLEKTNQELYQALIEQLRSEGITVEAGKFQAMMEVALINDGPVTLIVDSNKEYY